MDTVAVFIANYTFDNSPSILNFLELLSQNYWVDLYLYRVYHKTSHLLRKPSIRIVYDSDGLRGPTVLKLVRRAPAYKGTICFDPHGFELCKKLFPTARPVYYSLELYLKDDHAGLDYQPFLMNRERREIHTISGLIIQSQEKENLFRCDYALAERIPAFILPVTYRGPAVTEKGTLLRERYGIALDKKIALHLGGIARWFSCFEIALMFSELDDWVLVFHGYPERSYVNETKKALAERGVNNVVFCERVYSDIEDVMAVVASSDLGIAWYNNISAGFRTAGRSSGKISAYFKAGLPVVAKKYPSTVEAIEAPGAGKCVDDLKEIPSAVRSIEADYASFAEAALAEYGKWYRFENYSSEIVGFLETAFSSHENKVRHGSLTRIIRPCLRMVANKIRR